VNARFGFRNATAGDISGDGISEIIIGSYLYDSSETDEGKVFVYYGSPGELRQTSSWFSNSYRGGRETGNCVSSAGDVNGDGYKDVIVGDWLHFGERGIVSVYHGSQTGLSTTPNWVYDWIGPAANFGYSASTAGDVNGDGFSDIIVRAPSWDTVSGNIDEGAAFVFYGSASGLSTSPNWRVESN